MLHLNYWTFQYFDTVVSKKYDNRTIYILDEGYGGILLSLHFESFNKECITIKEEYARYMLSQETKLKVISLLLNLCPSKSPTPAL